MKIFISWSGERSKAAAAALNEFLPVILHNVDCWMSDENLSKGKPWFDQLRNELNQILFGIVCATPENAKSQWLHWEAGFLSSASPLGDKRVAPLVIGMPKNGIAGGPLGIYQATEPTRADMLRLIKDINSSLANGKVAEIVLEKTFDYVWHDLDSRLQAAVNLEKEAPAPHVPEGEQYAEILALLRSTQRELAITNERISGFPRWVVAGPQEGFVGPGGYGVGAAYGGGLIGNPPLPPPASIKTPQPNK